MAIDTRDRRSSAMNHKCPWRRHRPLADGTIGAADRKHLAKLYAALVTEQDIPSATAKNVYRRPTQNDSEITYRRV